MYLQNNAMPDFSHPLYRADMVLVTNNPARVEPIYNVVRVFDIGTWLSILASLIAVTVIYSITSITVKVGKQSIFY